MRVGEALRIMNEAYETGCAQFYEAMVPDPWEQAHDDLERVMIDRGAAIDHPACDIFLERTLHLIDQYKIFRRGSGSRFSFKDAFYVGNVERTKRAQSIRDKVCYRCESRKNLTLHTPKDSDRVAIVCHDCKRKAAG